MSGRPAVFLDRDGVVDELVPDPVSGLPESPLDAADVRLVPGAAAAIGQLQGAGFVVISVSNQPAAAKGLVTEQALAEVHSRVVELLSVEGIRLDDSEWCLHHPDAVVERLRQACACRKPGAGMLLAGATKHSIDLAESWMVGDTDADVQAGRAAGCATVLVENPDSAHKRTARVQPDFRAADLAGAFRIIYGRSRPG